MCKQKCYILRAGLPMVTSGGARVVSGMAEVGAAALPLGQTPIPEQRRTEPGLGFTACEGKPLLSPRCRPDFLAVGLGDPSTILRSRQITHG